MITDLETQIGTEYTTAQVVRYLESREGTRWSKRMHFSLFCQEIISIKEDGPNDGAMSCMSFGDMEPVRWSDIRELGDDNKCVNLTVSFIPPERVL